MAKSKYPKMSWHEPTSSQEMAKASPAHGSKYTNEPLPLPSSDSARDVVDGKSGAIEKAALHAGGRACLIGLGMYAIGGERDFGVVFRGAIGGSIMIEAFALGWFKYQEMAKKKT